MDDDVKIEREKRKKKRKMKKCRSTIVTITLLFILCSVGVVSAQTQGYEVYYHGESLGYVQTASIFESAVDRIETSLGECYRYENIQLGDGFELVPARVENPMDFDAWIKVLNNRDIELYINGATIIMGDQEIGTMTSLDEAQRVIDSFQNMCKNTNIVAPHFVEKKVPISKTKDFSTVLTDLKALAK